MRDEPVLALTGPRTVGKSALLRRLADQAGRRVLDLDEPTSRQVVADDVSFYLSADPPVFVDEFQHVPVVLDAIKAELNRDASPGRFVLAGSTRYATLPRTAQSLTGRVHVVTVWPLSQGEIGGITETFLQRLLDEPATLVSLEPSSTGREDYAGRILSGGLPAALRRAPRSPRSRWFGDYGSLVVERDVLELRSIRQSAALPDFLRRLAAQTGQVLNSAAPSRGGGRCP